MKKIVGSFLLSACIASTAFGGAWRSAYITVDQGYQMVGNPYTPVNLTFTCSPDGNPYNYTESTGSDDGFPYVKIDIYGPYGGAYNYNNTACKPNYFSTEMAFQVKSNKNEVATCIIETAMSWTMDYYYYQDKSLSCTGNQHDFRIYQCSDQQSWFVGSYWGAC